ncbi:MAG: hypothetical protein QOG68_676 [Solirubrobacteraceae bacterium]|nr:hypothetical protein [Solirubrobacteraceae bacterium]
MRLAVLACLALAALTLLGPHQPTYDPWAWLSWGREIAHGHLATNGGPSWKPLPVLFTVPLSLFGSAAPLLWLVVARAGLLLAFVAGFRLASSVAGPAAGAITVAGMALLDRFVGLSARGTSEGLLVALALGAVDRHRAGRRGQALLLGFGAALVRPEAWPFLGLYALWLTWQRTDPGDRIRTLALMTLGGVVLLAAWFVPEELGSGSLLRGASRARDAVEGTPAQSAFPFLAVFSNSAGAAAIPLYAGGVFVVLKAVRAWRRGGDDDGDRDARDLVLGLAAASCGYMVIVAVLAQAGFTGNERYVLLPASVVCILGAIGLVQGARELAGRFAPRWSTVVLVVAGLALCVSPALRLGRKLQSIQRESDLYGNLAAVIDRAGGRSAITRCGPVYTDPFQTQIVLWHLDLSGSAVGIHPNTPGTVVAPLATAAGHDGRFALRVSQGGWVVRSTCR